MSIYPPQKSVQKNQTDTGNIQRLTSSFNVLEYWKTGCSTDALMSLRNDLAQSLGSVFFSIRFCNVMDVQTAGAKFLVQEPEWCWSSRWLCTRDNEESIREVKIMGCHDFRSIFIARTVLDGSLRVIIRWRRARMRCKAETAYFSVNVTKFREMLRNITKCYEIRMTKYFVTFRNTVQKPRRVSCWGSENIVLETSSRGLMKIFGENSCRYSQEPLEVLRNLV